MTYGPILTTAGLLSGGKLTQKARDRYIDEVIALLITGNEDGKGGAPTTQIFSSIVPLPPVAGPKVANVTTLSTEHVFWFGPDPVAALLATRLKDRSKTEFWHKIFPDLLYEKTAVALDVGGTTPLFPVFDVSGAFGIDLPLPFKLPELALELSLTPPELGIKLSDLGIKLKPPSLPVPPIPPKLDFPDLSIPGVAFPGLPSLVLPQLLLGLIKMPFDIIAKLVLPPDLGLVTNLPKLPKIVLDLAFDILFGLLTDLGLLLIVPKVMMASILIYVKNIVAMVCVDIVGLLVGAGNISKSAAVLTGLL